MKKLARLLVSQFYVFHKESFELGGHIGFLGPNGTGKTAVLDAIQIIHVGANQRHLTLNSQKDEGGENRTIADYCLGKINEKCVRNESLTYLCAVYRDDADGTETTIGLCLAVDGPGQGHELLGLFVIDGGGLALDDVVEEIAIDGGALRDSPVPFSDFKAAMKHRFGDHAFFVKTQADFVAQYLKCLQGAHSIHPKTFLRAFHQAVMNRPDFSGGF